MNADRRKRIAGILAQLEPLVSELEALHDEENEAFESMPEGLQQAERGQASEAAVDQLDEAKSSVESAVDALQGIE